MIGNPLNLCQLVHQPKSFNASGVTFLQTLHEGDTIQKSYLKGFMFDHRKGDIIDHLLRSSQYDTDQISPFFRINLTK